MTTPERPPNGSKFLQTWGPIGASVVIIIGAVSSYFVTQGTTASTIATMQDKMAQQDQRLAALERQAEVMRTTVATQKQSVCQQLAKVETQFGTVETSMNQARVDDLRVRAAFWEKIFGERYSDAFYEIKIPHEIQSC